MTVLPHGFMVLICIGIWQPVELTTTYKIKLYSLYTAVSMFFMCSFALLQFIQLALKKNTVEEIVDTCFLFLTVTWDCVKASNILFMRKKIINIIQIFEVSPNAPTDLAEKDIQRKFDGIARICTLAYLGGVWLTWGSLFISSFYLCPFGVLPYRAWLPYNYDTTKIYWFTFYLQHTIIFYAAMVNVGYGTLVAGFIMHICAKLNILSHRLKIFVSNNCYANRVDSKQSKSTNNKTNENILIQCIQHHLSLIQLSRQINDMFEKTIFIQLSISSLVICIDAFMLSRIKFGSPEFIAIFVYMGIIISEIFLFCAAGNELILESSKLADKIYHMDWVEIPNHLKKCFMMMILRSQTPMVFRVYNVINLSLDSFVKVIKLSYSSYNLLKQQGSK